MVPILAPSVMGKETCGETPEEMMMTSNPERDEDDLELSDYIEVLDGDFDIE